MYYIHFEFINLHQAKKILDNYYAYESKLLAQEKILLVCSCGITTSLFAHQLQQIANAMYRNYQIDATDLYSLEYLANQYDYIFLAPQIAHKKMELSRLYKDKLDVIDTNIFATNQYSFFLTSFEKNHGFA